MPRPRKCRRICGLPDHRCFAPTDGASPSQVTMTLDEYEAVRLIDRLCLTQEDCAQRMGIARSTVAGVYEQARRKLAALLIDGSSLRIEGGEVSFCAQNGPDCPRCAQGGFPKKLKQVKKESYEMNKIAVTYENGEIFQHFGHTEQFKLYTIAKGQVASSEVVGTNGSGHGALAGFLKTLDVDTLICGGIGGGAKTALAEAGIAIYPGAQGNADKAVADLLCGELSYNPDTHCSHHGHEHDHACGEAHEHHTCGGHCGG